MKYSIILPVRNGGHHLRTCVNSILTQSLADFNLIILDNCSTDGTLEWLQSITDSRVMIIPSSKPLTIEESWARIRDTPKNEFITLIGHDDILYPDFLATIDNLINSQPSASLYLTHFDLIDAKGKIIRACKPMPSIYTGDGLLKEILINSVDLMGTGYVMRSADYDRIGGIPVKYPSLLYADFELWVNLASLSFEAISSSTCFAFRMHQSTAHSSQDSRMHRAMDILIDYLSLVRNRDEKMRTVVDQYGAGFLLFYCRGFSHRLLRKKLADRDGMTVEKMIDQTKQWAAKIGLDKEYDPEKISSIRLALTIDRNPILRGLFLLWKRIYPKSVIKK